ncbi:MAG: carboxymuconolactone decarboxylase family protein, partial [Nitrospinaceae bacterium]|nr:carboxymuconolactone decarboxylase family protein [Nitrospinaceae bacterium]
MPRMNAIEPDNANQEMQELYQQVENNLVMLPNMVKTLANAP